MPRKQKEEKAKFVKVLSVEHIYTIEDMNFMSYAKAWRTIARVVDTKGKVSTIRTTDSINVGDEIDIVSHLVKGNDCLCGTPTQETYTQVVRNRTMDSVINDFVARNKTKSR